MKPLNIPYNNTSARFNVILIAISTLFALFGYISTNYELFIILPIAVTSIIYFFNTPIKLGYVLVCSLAISKECSINETTSIDLPDEALMLLVTVYTVTYLLKYGLQSIKILLSDNLFTIILFSLLYLLINIFWSEQPLLSLKYFLAKIWYIIPFFVFPIIIQKQFTKWIYVAMAILTYVSAIVSSIVIIYHAYLGFHFETVNTACQLFFSNHVTYGSFVAILLPIAYFHYKHNILFKKYKNIHRFIVVIFLVALIESYCRSAWLASIVGVIALFLYYYKALIKSLIITLCVIVGFFCWLVLNNNYLYFKNNFKKTEFHTEWNQHWQATFNGKDVSNAERFYRWAAGINMAASYAPLGSGSNTFYPIYKDYRINAFKTWVSNNKEHSTVHNYFLLLLIEQGFIGLLLFIALLFTFYYQVQYFPIEKEYKAWRLLLIMVFTTIIMQLTSSDLLESDKVGTFLFFSLSIWVMLKNNLIPKPESHKN